MKPDSSEARKTAAAALDALRGVGGNVVGVIINDMPRGRSGYGYYRGVGYYGDRAEPRRAALPLANGDGEADDSLSARSSAELPPAV